MSNLDYEREDEEDLLNQAEEFKIIASCILRIKELKDLRYTTSRILLDGVVQIGIDFEVQLEASVVNIIKKLLSRELFEYGRNENEYKLLIGEKWHSNETNFSNACIHLRNEIIDKFWKCLSPYMELRDVKVEPTTAGRIGRNLLGMQEYPLALRIHATRPRDAYLTEDEEVESAQASCMRYVEGLPNIAAKHVRYVQILTH